MKKILPLLFLLIAYSSYAQESIFSPVRLIPLDSAVTQLPRTFRSIKTRQEPLPITLNDKTYSFTSTRPEGPNSYPELTTSFDDKYDLRIMEWELRQANAQTLTFDVYYARFNKQKGTQKGKVYLSREVLIDRAAVEGAYQVTDVDKPISTRKKVSFWSIGAGAAIVALAVILLR
jgi:hypothetical protein